MFKLNSLVVTAFILVLSVYYINAINFPWMYYLPYGKTVTLKPLFKNRTQIITVNSCKWTTPKQLDITPESENYDTTRYKLNPNTCELTIFNNQKDTNGIYHCTVNGFYISKAMLNVHGAPKSSQLEEYTPNLIAGFSTAGGIIAFFAITCGIYSFRYKEPIKVEKIPSAKFGKEDIMEVDSYKNQAFEESDEFGSIRL